MEVIKQQPLPGVFHFFLRIGVAVEQRDGGEFLGVEHGFFAAPDAPLGFRLRRHHAPVVLEVKFVFPSRHFQAGKFFLKVVEKSFGRT